jgi:predicted nucleotidyltransferase
MDVSSETLSSRLRQHAPVWSERFGVRSLRIFGSWARGTATPSSNVDLLVAFDGPATALRRPDASMASCCSWKICSSNLSLW